MRFPKHGSEAAIETEIASLKWLAEAKDGAPVAELLGRGKTWLETRYLTSGIPTAAAGEEFGRALAHTHAAGASRWGQAPRGLPAGELRLANLISPADQPPGPDAPTPKWHTWGEFYAEARVRPHVIASDWLPAEAAEQLHSACDRIAAGEFDHEQPRLVVESQFGAQKVARCHGDLWSGNLLWAETEEVVQGVLIDPSAHGAHAETDLANLALFGCPQLKAIRAGYQEVSPLAPGWEQRIGLHQLHLLVVHVRLFGETYLGSALKAVQNLTPSY